MPYVDSILGGLKFVVGGFSGHPTEWLLTLFNAILALYTWRLYRATRTLAEADRPHLVPKTFVLSGLRNAADPDDNITLEFQFRLQNYGKSPAFVTRYCIMHMDVDSIDEMPVQPPYGTPTATRHIIAPNDWYGSAAPSNIVLSADTVLGLISGKKKAITVGYVEYHGFSGTQHKIRFAYVFEFGPGDHSVRAVPVGPNTYWEYV